MKTNFEFSNLCGTVYQQGNILFTNDGNSVLSPVGNRITVFDLLNNKSYTLPFQTRRNIAAQALSPDGNILLAIDNDGRAVLLNLPRRVVLHHINFKAPVPQGAVKFSPDGEWIAVAHGSKVQVWKTPSVLVRTFVPFELHRTYTGHFEDVVSVEWAADSSCFITTSKDMTARLFTLHPLEGFRPKTFAGHRDVVVNAYFSSDSKTIYTISRDGAVFVWTAKPSEEDDSDEDAPLSKEEKNENPIANTRWGISKRHYFNQPGTKVTSCAFHTPSSLLVVGFSTGIFGLYELPSFTPIHTLSISHEKISSVSINPSGEYLAFGARKLGQLLVWEWQSESYVLKQQGHYFDINTLSYAPDGQYVATGGEDGKVKLWDTNSGFCLITFSEHSSSISSVEFAPHGKQVVFSASLDGTVRAFDLVRYRNFRTFTSPSPVGFTCLAVDASGEVVAAGSTDGGFGIYVWSVQTGKLLDVLTGHSAPVSALAFSPSGGNGNVLASASWDKSLRLWNVFDRSRAVEAFQLNSDALAIAFRPDGKEVAIACLDGQIVFFDVSEGKQSGLIEGRKDLAGGRKKGEVVGGEGAGRHFNSVCYTADGECILAGGNSKYVLLYSVPLSVLLRKFTISENIDIDGTQDYLDSRLSSFDVDGGEEESDVEDRLEGDRTLPGVQRGDMSKRRLVRREARTKCVRFSPSDASFAAASTEGLLLFSSSSTTSSANFDPFDLTMEITPAAVQQAQEKGECLNALIVALRLNEKQVLRRAYEGVPKDDIKLVVRQLPIVYLASILRLVASRLSPSADSGGGASPHLEFDLRWVRALLVVHGRYLRDHSRSMDFGSVLRALRRGLGEVEGVVRICDENTATLSFLIDQARVKAAHENAGAGGGEEAEAGVNEMQIDQ